MATAIFINKKFDFESVYFRLRPFARRCLGVAAKRDVSSNMKPEFGRQQRLLEIENMYV